MGRGLCSLRAATSEGQTRAFLLLAAGVVLSVIGLIVGLMLIVSNVYQQSSEHSQRSQFIDFSQSYVELNRLLRHGSVIADLGHKQRAGDRLAAASLREDMRRAEDLIRIMRQTDGSFRHLEKIHAVLSLYSGETGSDFPLNSELDQKAIADALLALDEERNSQVLEYRNTINDTRRAALWGEIGFVIGLCLLLGACLSGLRVLDRLYQRSNDLSFQRQRARALIGGLPGAVLVCRIDGTIVDQSSSAESLLGYPSAAIAGENVEALFPERLRAQFQVFMRNVLSQDGGIGSGSKGRELMMVSHSRRELAVEVQLGRFEDAESGTMFLLQLRDISDQKLLHEQYQYSEKRFNMAMFASGDGIWDWNLRSDIVYVSPTWLSLVGSQRRLPSKAEELFASFISDRDQKSLHQKMIEFLRSDLHTAHMEHRLKCANGELIDVSCHFAAERDALGRVIRIVGVHKNIAEFRELERRQRAETRQLEDKLRLSEMRLRQAEQDAAEAARGRETFFSVIGHEIRTPMNAVVGMSDLLLKTRLDREQKNMLDTIRRSSSNLLTTLDGIVDFSALESGELQLECEHIQLLDVVENLVEGFAPQAAKNKQQLLLRVDPNLGTTFYSDPQRFRQLLSALLENALKFSVLTVPRGVVQLRLRAAADNDLSRHAWAGLVIEVWDNGVGIPSGIGDKIFAPFVQGEVSRSRRFGGLGLGLAMANGLVRMMGGLIEVDKAGGEWTCFRVVLPSRHRLVADIGAESRDDAMVLLYTEDSRLRENVALSLQRYGWWARQFSDRESLLNKLRSMHLGQGGQNLILLTDNASQVLADECEKRGVHRTLMLPRPRDAAAKPAGSGVYLDPLLPSQLNRQLERAISPKMRLA